MNEVNATRDERKHLLSVQSDGTDVDDSDVLIQHGERRGKQKLLSFSGNF